jgi:hypothetical protein
MAKPKTRKIKMEVKSFVIIAAAAFAVAAKIAATATPAQVEKLKG